MICHDRLDVHNSYIYELGKIENLYIEAQCEAKVTEWQSIISGNIMPLSKVNKIVPWPADTKSYLWQLVIPSTVIQQKMEEP